MLGLSIGADDDINSPCATMSLSDITDNASYVKYDVDSSTDSYKSVETLSSNTVSGDRRNDLLSIKDMLLMLNDAARKLYIYSHSFNGSRATPLSSSSLVAANDSVIEAYELCSIIEMILLYNTRDFFGISSLWGMLERLEYKNSLIAASVAYTSNILCLHTNDAKIRAWIRYALNHKLLDTCLTSIANEAEHFIKLYCDDGSIFLSPADMVVFTAITRSLKVIPFNYSLCSDKLNIHPHWFKYVKDMNASRSSAKLVAASIVNSIESRVSSMMQYVDSNLIGNVGNALYYNSNTGSGGGIAGNSSSNRGRSVIPFFGTHLEKLIANRDRCAYAHIEPTLGIPTQVIRMVSFLKKHLQCPGIFVSACSVQDLKRMKKSMDSEELGDIPQNANPVVVSKCLLYWLYSLPEPLLGYDHYDAFLTCQEFLSDDTNSIRNLELLIQETPWYSQPTFCLIMQLFFLLSLPHNQRLNRLTYVQLGAIVAPFILRSKHFNGSSSSSGGRYDIESSTYSSSDSHVFSSTSVSYLAQYIVSRYVEVVMPLEDDLKAIQLRLASKCSRVRYYCSTVTSAFTAKAMTGAVVDKQVLQLYNALQAPYTALMNGTIDTSSSASIASNSDNIQTLLKHECWGVCGFNNHEKDNPLVDFQSSPGGCLAINSLIYFLSIPSAYTDRNSTDVLVSFVRDKHQYCTLSQVSIKICKVLAQLLRLTDSSNSGYTYIQEASMDRKLWQLLSHPHCFEELFCLGLDVFHQLWIDTVSISDEGLPSTDTCGDCVIATVRVLERMLATDGAASVKDCYHLWKGVAANSRTAVPTHAVSSSSYTGTS